MAYYLRAFCTSEELPPLRRVLAWAATQGLSLELEGEQDELDREHRREAEVRYMPDKQPLTIDAHRPEDADDLLSDEVEEFSDLLEDVGDSAASAKVLSHLRESRAIVAVRLPSDVDDDGYAAAGALLPFFVDHCGAMIQADGEGFYEGDRLLVELE